MWYFQWYLQRRMIPVTYTLLPLLQILCIVWALCCSLTRITDRRHHWWDVLAGSIVGVATSVYAVSISNLSFYSNQSHCLKLKWEKLDWYFTSMKKKIKTQMHLAIIYMRSFFKPIIAMNLEILIFCYTDNFMECGFMKWTNSSKDL